MSGLRCKELVELITDYLEGKLPSAERKRFEDHLSGCDGCAHYLEQMRRTIRLMGRLREEALSLEQKRELTRLFERWRNA